eukprot:CAMPEP_0117426038 /NCGR_PEP_ID=MMETSP0758-20121206/6219_1 /TAXON_ID=63605 /ORGANISM="Percolomonas cosmopolitus, Strain AE-1 (ATCC 50343)" /LENGTH=270 /DNA_ID=CAMNT_0005210941 /DNA_START=648 /DNA_END=1460 /DNA_ORIENTATION=+
MAKKKTPATPVKTPLHQIGDTTLRFTNRPVESPKEEEPESVEDEDDDEKTAQLNVLFDQYFDQEVDIQTMAKNIKLSSLKKRPLPTVVGTPNQSRSLPDVNNATTNINEHDLSWSKRTKIQVGFQFRSNMSITITALLTIHQPVPNFIRIPIVITLSNLQISVPRSTLLIYQEPLDTTIAYIEPTWQRVRHRDGQTRYRLKTNNSPLKDFTLDVELGAASKFRDRSKIDAFVRQQVEKMVSSLFVYPNVFEYFGLFEKLKEKGIQIPSYD